MKAIDTTIVELRRLVTPVLGLTTPEGYGYGALEAIRIRSNEGYLTADATDRFVAGVSRRPAPGVAKGFDELVRAKDLKTLLRVAKPSSVTDVPIRLHKANDAGSVLVEVGESRDMAGMQFTFNTLGKSTPADLWQIFDRALREGEGPDVPFGINPELFAVFAAATARDVNESNLPLIVRSPKRPNGAMLVACGDHFLGLLMPMKTVPEVNDEVLSQWISLIAPLKPGAAAKAGAA